MGTHRDSGGCPSPPQSSWQPFGDTNAPINIWKYAEMQERTVFGETLGAPVSSNTRVRDFIHRVQCGIFPKRLTLPYPDEEILSGYEADVSSIRDVFSAWLKTDPEVTPRRHIVDAKGANPAFREAPAGKLSTSCQECHFNSDVPNQLTEPRRLSIFNWNPGPRRGKEGAIEKLFAVKWHIITLQEAIEYLDHQFLT